jgi:hypothetical protein
MTKHDRLGYVAGFLAAWSTAVFIVVAFIIFGDAR